MTIKEIIEGNRIIAEFMGITNLQTTMINVLDELNLKFHRKSRYEIDGLCSWCHNDVSHGHDFRCYVLDDEKLHYHFSWDWLIPVVKKCKETDPRVYSQTHIGHYLKEFDIAGAWQEVVSFIKYYNLFVS